METSLAPSKLSTDADLAVIGTQVAQAVSELLGISNPPFDAGFLELGGTSMDMLHLQFFIQETFAVHLKFATLHQFSTIQQLSLLILESRGSDAAPGLFRLRASAYPRAVVAFIDTKGYDFLEYMETSKHIEPAVEVVYLEWKAIDREEPVGPQIDAFAANYARLLEENYPLCTVTLVATCDGAVVAYECFRKLKARQAIAARLVIVDTRAHCPERMTLGYYAGRFRSFLASPRAERQRKLSKHLRNLSVRLRQGVSRTGTLLPPSKSISWIGGFGLRPLEGDLTLVRGLDSHIQVPGDETLGWKPLVEGRFAIHFLPGNHYDLFQSPQVEAFSALLGRIALENSMV